MTALPLQTRMMSSESVQLNVDPSKQEARNAPRPPDINRRQHMITCMYHVAYYGLSEMIWCSQHANLFTCGRAGVALFDRYCAYLTLLQRKMKCPGERDVSPTSVASAASQLRQSLARSTATGLVARYLHMLPKFSYRYMLKMGFFMNPFPFKLECWRDQVIDSCRCDHGTETMSHLLRPSNHSLFGSQVSIDIHTSSCGTCRWLKSL